jgi:hypothetical protein
MFALDDDPFDPAILDDCPAFTPEEELAASLAYAEAQDELTDYDVQMLRFHLQNIQDDLEPEEWGFYDMRINSLEIRHGLGG